VNPDKDPPWIMRTYSGHASPEAPNELHRLNMVKGQTDLSVAFDLPTQTGYDPDHPLARGEVGRVGVPISHLGDMRALFEAIPIERMNTSMTINATAPWLLALYIALAQERGIDPRDLQGTTQNDIIQEYVCRGTHIFPPRPSLQIAGDVVQYTVQRMPSWNPIHICSYHLQEAGASPVLEVAYALAAAVAMLDEFRTREGTDAEQLQRVFGRTSFCVSSGVRFVQELCKMRAFGVLWERIGKERYGVTDPSMLRFRYDAQVSSLGLTSPQPENNIVRIVLEALGVTLSKQARAEAIQLPAWNEALGPASAWDQQWSLRVQQILAHETDLLEYEDLLDGSAVVARVTEQIVTEAWQELQHVVEMGGAGPCVESGYIKQRLIASHAARIAAVEGGNQIVVGVNAFTATEPSPLDRGDDSASTLILNPVAVRVQLRALRAWRASRDPRCVQMALHDLKQAAQSADNIMPASISAARAGVTTGEWADALREVFGEYRAATGLAAAAGSVPRPEVLLELRAEAERISETLGRRVKILLGKPGLDGHSNAVEQIALRARDVGFEVVYEGIRVTPARIARAARDEGVHLVGLSILGGAQVQMATEVLQQLRKAGLAHVPVIVGGNIPEAEVNALRAAGVACVYTPEDYAIDSVMRDVLELVRTRHYVG
jgi:ethylmalonyl-CoA mutase